MTADPRSYPRKRLRRDRCSAALPASRSGWRRYTGSAADRQCGADAGLRAGGRDSPAAWRRWRAAKSRRWSPAESADAPARPRVPRRRRPASASLADWRGRTVLLNLWATWCVPCRKEMPALDALAGQARRPEFEVVAVNIDTRDPDKPQGLAQGGRRQPARLLRRPERQGVPGAEGRRHARSACRPRCWSIRHGCEIGTLAGPAEWASDDAVKLVSAALAK